MESKDIAIDKHLKICVQFLHYWLKASVGTPYTIDEWYKSKYSKLRRGPLWHHRSTCWIYVLKYSLGYLTCSTVSSQFCSSVIPILSKPVGDGNEPIFLFANRHEATKKKQEAKSLTVVANEKILRHGWQPIRELLSRKNASFKNLTSSGKISQV